MIQEEIVLKKNIFKTLIATGVAAVVGVVTFNAFRKNKVSEDCFEDDIFEDENPTNEKVSDDNAEEKQEETVSVSEEEAEDSKTE